MDGADPRAFLDGVRPQIRAKLQEEIKALNGIKFQLALKVQLRKDNPDGSEEYTDPVRFLPGANNFLASSHI